MLLAGNQPKNSDVKRDVSAAAQSGSDNRKIIAAAVADGVKSDSKDQTSARKALEKKRRVLEEIIDQKVDSVISDYFD